MHRFVVIRSLIAGILIALGGAATYSESFVEHYLIPVLYPAALTREIQIALGLLVLAINALAYAAAARRWRSASAR